MPTVPGIHHVTAITADAQKNIDFYCGTLGLRLVKLTVNFDDPSSYHLYYGDELGRPGSIMTFFAWPRAARGHLGPPQVTATAFSAPPASLSYWRERLAGAGVTVDAGTRFGADLLAFRDADGTPLEIVGDPADTREPWRSGPVPEASAIRGFHAVTITEEGYEQTAALMTERLGFRAAGEEGNRFRYAAPGASAAVVDIVCAPGSPRGRVSAGTVHHVAFRTAGDEAQQAWRQTLAKASHNVSPVMDRQYFRSIYFREPGGVLFEIATDAPGFTVDEPAAHLGAALKLPPQFEPVRARIEAALPRLRLPGAAGGSA